MIREKSRSTTPWSEPALRSRLHWMKDERYEMATRLVQRPGVFHPTRWRGSGGRPSAGRWLLVCHTPPLRMRLHFGPIPSSPDFVPAAPWRSLRQLPAPWMENLLALPLGIAAATAVSALWLLITPLRDITPAMSLPAFLLMFAGLVVVHELIHALVHPMAGLSPRSILGFWAALGFYAHYDGEMSRNRLVACLLMPLLVISIVPLLLSAATQVSSGWVAFVSAFNALCACVDILLAGSVLIQIPATAIIRFKSWRIFWREPDPLAA